jgi:hypothetical protein
MTTVSRRAGIAVLLCVACSTFGKPAEAAAAVPSQCTSRALRGDAREAECELGPGRHAFAAVFGGSHDDTTISMSLSIGGRPLTCDAGAKTYSEHEEGEVTLACRFTLADPGATRLTVRLEWHHAIYERVMLTRE